MVEEEVVVVEEDSEAIEVVDEEVVETEAAEVVEMMPGVVTGTAKVVGT